MITMKRVYDKPSPDDGYRVLVDRLWPRGVSKEKAGANIWLKEIGPSHELRTWYGHDPAKFDEFKSRYITELNKNPAVGELLKIIKQNDKVCLLYSAHDGQHSQAAVLMDYLPTRQ